MSVKAVGVRYLCLTGTVYICFDWLKDNRLHKL